MIEEIRIAVATARDEKVRTPSKTLSFAGITAFRVNLSDSSKPRFQPCFSLKVGANACHHWA